MANVEQSICDAIDIIVDKAVSEAAYDKTVRATIVSCEDESAGYYKLHYQDSTIYAYSLQTDYTYATGTSVYVLVPADDMTNTKTILGTTDKLGNDYIAVVEPEDQFSVVGTNVITCNDTYALQSYRQEGCSINLYNKNNTNNAIDVDVMAVEQYFAESDVLICGGVMQTALTREQQTQGDYGIIFTLEFIDQATGAIVERQYPVNVDIMTGQPYNYISPTRQYGIFEFDKENFVDIEDITIYSKDFPHWKNNPEDDIFISAIEMEGAVAVSQEDLNGYYLSLTTAKGTYFAADALDTETLTAEAVLRDAGKIVNIDSQDLPVYWFVEHAGITPKSQYYCSFGGSGWKCLNEYLLISDETEDAEAVVEWIPGDKTFTLAKADLKARSAQYKCVVIYNSTAVSATVTFKNLGSKYDIAIESTNGTKFYFDVGSTSLITTVNDEEARGSEYSYAWAISDAFGNYTTLTNDDVTSALEVEYEEKYQEILNDDDLYEEQKEVMLEELNAEYKELLSGTYVDGNRVENIKASSIYIFNTYKCSVFEYDDFIGTVSITLLNSDEASNYSLVMNNNSYTYKYDESGVSPTSSSNLSPLVLVPLTYTLYDCDGQDITEEVFNVCTVRWYVPPSDVSLLTIPDSYDSYIVEDEEAQDYTVYEGIRELAYEIALKYNIAKITNDIYLTVSYKDMLLIAKSNLTFVKQGENGTNGTEYSCKIVPNVADGAAAPVNVVVSQVSTDSYSYNYTVTQNHPLKVQLYHNELLVFDGYDSNGTTADEDLDVKLTWSVLQNKYRIGLTDSSNITITDSANGTMTWDPSVDSAGAANIVQVQVDVGEETTLYATLPILSVRYSDQETADAYTLKLKDNTGFLYATYVSDGTSPQWSNLTPFTFDVTKVVDGVECSIMDEIDESYQYRSFVGQVYDTSKNEWQDADNLENYTNALHEEEGAYQWWVKPSDRYDGWCVTNGLIYTCVIPDKDAAGNNITPAICGIAVCGTTICGELDGAGTATIHVPVHLMINRYGLASLNGWDGNSIQIDEEGGFILAPQIGAGHKEDDNSFTGMVMGDVRESGNSSYNVASGLETGLFAYNNGRRTIFLDATTGKSVFGMTGMGQIIIDPGDPTDSNNNPSAQIYSGNYYEDDNKTLTGEGLCIDLLAPYIKYGNGNFEVDEDGNLTAKGHGHIAGWYIDDYTIYTAPSNEKAPSYTYNDETGELDIADVYISSAQFTKTINNEKLSNLRISVGDNFGLTATGEVYSNTLYVGAGKNKIIISEELDDKGNIVDKQTVVVDDDGNTEEVSTHSAIYYQKQGFDVNQEGFYLGTDGIALGKYNGTYGHSMFQVDAGTGEFVAQNGYIGTKSYGWRIENTYVYNGKAYFNDPTSGIFIGTGKYQYEDDEDKSKIYGGIAIGNAGSYDTSPFQVTIDGELTARSGYIGNPRVDSSGNRDCWIIKDSSLYNRQTEYAPSEDSNDFGNKGIYLGTDGIGFGNGKFYVTDRGVLYAQGGGTLAGWTIDEYSIYTNSNDEYDNDRVSSSDICNVRLSAGTFKRYLEGFSSDESDPIKNLRFAIGNKFAINNQGDLYANNANIIGDFNIQGTGNISGWKIDDYSIYTGKSPSYRGGDEGKGEVDTVDVILSSSKFYKNNINSTSREDWRITVGDNFGITSEGNVYASNLLVGSGRKKITIGTIDNSSSDEENSGIYYNKSTWDSNSAGFYLGTDGIALGTRNKFSVNTEGVLTSTSGTIGGWTIDDTTLSSSTSSYQIILSSSNLEDMEINGITVSYLRIVLGSNFGVTRSGALYSSSGNIGGFTIGSSSLYTNSKTSYNGTTAGVHIGNSGIGVGTGTFYVRASDGYLYSGSGSIGGWDISSTTISRWTSDNGYRVRLYAPSSPSSSDHAFDVQNSSGANLFYVTYGGAIYANSGTIGGLSIDATTLSSLSTQVTNNTTNITQNTTNITKVETDLGSWYASGNSWTNGTLSLSGSAINTSNSTLYFNINGDSMMAITKSGVSAVYIYYRCYMDNEPYINNTSLTQYIKNVVNSM